MSKEVLLAVFVFLSLLYLLVRQPQRDEKGETGLAKAITFIAAFFGVSFLVLLLQNVQTWIAGLFLTLALAIAGVMAWGTARIYGTVKEPRLRWVVPLLLTGLAGLTFHFADHVLFLLSANFLILSLIIVFVWHICLVKETAELRWKLLSVIYLLSNISLIFVFAYTGRMYFFPLIDP